MKIILNISIILLIFGCSNTNVVYTNPPKVNLIVQQDKYSLIFKHHFYKNFKIADNDLAKYNIKINLSFNTSNALSINGTDNLNIVKGTVDFKIFNKLGTEIVKSGSIMSSINTGSVTSLYGIDENNNFAKERISKLLASRLYRKILMSFNQSEN